ncbi:hypothetical protein AB6A40_000705 [Gnathostoma spinigerum]|uniref:non-specific serine/threonine protein kinase n=1 Tax=Gnathostoma spinigerum TaxID=75299 RepID=A0ABD6E4P5_9BILA
MSDDTAESSVAPHPSYQRFRSSDDKVLVKQGAEARLHKCIFLGRPAILKERFCKKYRHPVLDEQLTKTRIKAELKAICKCKTIGVDVPAVLFVDSGKNEFIMEEIPGELTAREFIEESRGKDNFHEVVGDFSFRMGGIIAKMHQAGVMHGDLTTSNVMLRNRDPSRVVFVDFGLSEGNATVEHKGVDLYVLERAISSTHFDSEFIFANILKGYETFSKKQYLNVFKKLEEIRRRGRKREMMVT